MSPDTLTHRLSRLARRLGLASLRFHDLRHSVATTLLGAGSRPGHQWQDASAIGTQRLPSRIRTRPRGA